MKYVENRENEAEREKMKWAFLILAHGLSARIARRETEVLFLEKKMINFYTQNSSLNVRYVYRIVLEKTVRSCCGTGGWVYGTHMGRKH